MKIIVPAQKDLLHVTGDYKAIAVNVSKCNGSCTVTQFRDVSMGKVQCKAIHVTALPSELPEQC